MKHTTLTTKQFAESHGITESSARAKLNKMLLEGKVKSHTQTIIRHRVSKSGSRARGKMVPVYGTTWEFL